MNNRRVIIPCDIPVEELRGAASGGTVLSMEGATMGTYWRAQCVVSSRGSHQEIYEALVECFALVVRQMSHFDSTSCLSNYNAAKAGTWCNVPSEFASVLRLALEVAELSQGAYDPAAGQLIDAYGFGAKPLELSSDSTGVSIGAIAKAHRGGIWSKIRQQTHDLSGEQGAFQDHQLFQPGGVELNLSSIAKGFAVDLACERLLAMGVKHHLIEIGGELRGHGCKPTGTPWWCDLEQPDDASNLEKTVVALCGLAIATSGDLVQQRLTKTGERISHIVDPRTGLPADGELALVTVMHASCCQADVWATALYVLGLDRGMQIAESLSLPVLFTQRVGSGYQEHLTSALQKMLD